MLQSTLCIVTVAVILTQAAKETKGLPALPENRHLLFDCSNNQDNPTEHKMRSWLQQRTGEITGYHPKLHRLGGI